MAARITSANEVIQLDRPAQVDERITEEDVQDAGKLSRLLMRIVLDIASMKRRFWPRRIDFEERKINGSSVAPETIRLTHGFNGPVRWWPVRVRAAGTVAVTLINETTASDNNTLVLAVYYQATITFRVESAG